MQTTDTSEKGLEDLIAASLVDEAGYARGSPGDYEREFCVDRACLFCFLQDSRPEAVKLLGVGSPAAEDKLLKRIADQVAARGAAGCSPGRLRPD